MRVIYVAGKFRDDSYWGMIKNIRQAELAAFELWEKGWVVICPHLNTTNFQGGLPDKVWLEGNLELLRRSDAIYMLKNYLTSEGALAELKLASDLGLEVLYEV